MKLETFEATFPELKGGAIYRTGRGEASTIAAAISRAVKATLKQNKGKRFHTIKAVITVIDKAEDQIKEESNG
jgi:hypothetical protein